MLADRTFCDQILEVLKLEFFEIKYIRVFASKIIEFKQEYEEHPTHKSIATILRASLEDENPAIQRQTRDFFARLYKTEVPESEKKFIKNTALDFCKKQKLKEAMIHSAKLLQNSSFDEIAELINEALKLGTDNDHGYDYLKDFEERWFRKVRKPVSTGWKIVDDLCDGGLGSGELGVVIAPTGTGKSMVLVHLGAEAIKNKKNVVHYTLELGAHVIASRYDSCITGAPLGDLHSFKDNIYETVKNLEGQLIIKEYPTKSATPATIKNHLERLRQRGIKVDMVIVDYADLLRPAVVRKEKRHELETIYEDLRAIGQVYECPVWTASQTNRAGLNAEVITMESISEAFNKCFVADFIFSVSRTAENKSTNGGRIFIAKNRNGPDGLDYPIKMDTSKVHIDILEESEGEKIIINTAKEQKKFLREKMNVYKSKGTL